MNKDKCGCECSANFPSLHSKADAICAVLVLAMSSDGKIKDREMKHLEETLRINPLFSKIKNYKKYIACIAESIYSRGRESTIESVKSILDKRFRETAYAMSVQMVMSDGKTVPSEHKFLDKIMRELNIHGVLAGKIKSVVAILKRTK